MRKKRRETAKEEYDRTHVRVLCYSCNKFHMAYRPIVEELGTECDSCVREESERLRKLLAERGVVM